MLLVQRAAERAPRRVRRAALRVECRVDAVGLALAQSDDGLVVRVRDRRPWHALRLVLVRLVRYVLLSRSHSHPSPPKKWSQQDSQIRSHDHMLLFGILVIANSKRMESKSS